MVEISNSSIEEKSNSTGKVIGYTFALGAISMLLRKECNMDAPSAVIITTGALGIGSVISSSAISGVRLLKDEIVDDVVRYAKAKGTGLKNQYHKLRR